MKHSELWVVRGGAGKRRSRANLGITAPVEPPEVDSFVLRVTKPDDTNTGTPYTTGEMEFVSGADAGHVYRVTYGGTQLNPRIIDAQDIEGRIVVNNGVSWVTFKRGRLTMANLPANTRAVGVTVFGGSTTGILFDHFTFRVPPSERTYFMGTMLQGRDISLNRCNISGTSDGFDPNGTSGVRGYGSIRGSHVHDLPHYAYDGGVGGGGHTDGSHNDGCQVSGLMTYFEAIGNTIEATHTSSILITKDVGDYTVPPVVEDNWFYEAPTAGACLNLKISQGSYGAASIQRNKFDVPAAEVGIVISDAARTAATFPRSGANMNVNTRTGLEVKVYNGTSLV